MRHGQMVVRIAKSQNLFARTDDVSLFSLQRLNRSTQLELPSKDAMTAIIL
jgi:hypothetical protein